MICGLVDAATCTLNFISNNCASPLPVMVTGKRASVPEGKLLSVLLVVMPTGVVFTQTVGVLVGVTVGVKVGVDVGVRVGVLVGVKLGVKVGVIVGVKDGV
jgi:hypothetical protein